MAYKKIIPYINAENEDPAAVTEQAKDYARRGADELFIYNYSGDEKAREEFLSLAKELTREIDIPIILGSYVKRLEDVKKAIYTGASAAMLRYSLIDSSSVVKEAAERFGPDKIILELDMLECLGTEGETLYKSLTDYKIGTVLLKHTVISDKVKDAIIRLPAKVLIRDSLVRNNVHNLLSLPNVEGIATNYYSNKDIMEAKYGLKENGIEVNVYESKLPFSDFKQDANGLIPVIVQDYRTGEVLMLAYMNEEAYNKTVVGGRMTYYSRSRNTLWLKGETSGHYQYVKELVIDCDKDTILAKVLQIGPACHTGRQSCFHTELVKKEYKNPDTLRVFNTVYDIITDRKAHPKEGSYTNYLFDKGIDKILKKCGEEATEITIAAKNPGAEELRYEIADYLYHLMVLMAECGLDWEDITTELAHRK